MEIDNIEHREDTSVYYVLEKKSPFGENEVNEDTHGHRRICRLLEFVPTTTGGFEYAALTIDESEWHLCRELNLVDKPSFDASLIADSTKVDYGID